MQRFHYGAVEFLEFTCLFAGEKRSLASLDGLVHFFDLLVQLRLVFGERDIEKLFDFGEDDFLLPVLFRLYQLRLSLHPQNSALDLVRLVFEDSD